MKDDRFGRWCFSHVLNGQRELADTLRMLVYKRNSELFEKLDFDNEECFLNPLLFAWFTDHGTVFPLERIFTEYSTERVSGTYRRITGTATEIAACSHPLLDRFFVGAAGHATHPEIEQATQAHTAQLNRAFGVLQTHCPDIASAIASCTRKVMLFRAPEPNSFAAMSAHGMVFLNVPEWADEVFFLEDLSHQCAHVLFNAMTFDKKRYLAIDPATMMSEVYGDSDEARTLYSAFHGLATYTLIVRVLSTLRGRSVLDRRQQHELAGRLAFTLKKFGWDLRRLDKPGLFTARGRLVYRRFAAMYEQGMASDGDLVEQLDVSNQPYNFDYASFAARNPLEQPAEALAP